MQRVLYGITDLRRISHDDDPGIFERPYLFLSPSPASGNDGPCVAHPSFRGGRHAGDVGDKGFLHGRLEELRCLFLLTASDFADEDDGLGPGVFLIKAEDINKRQSPNGIAPDAEAR